MAYSPASITSAGLTIPTQQDILDYLNALYRSIYGVTVDLSNDSADYQDNAIRALQAFDANNGLQILYLSLNPLTAIGPSLDLVGQLIGPVRKPATASTATVNVVGVPYTVITNGIVQDTTGNYWNLPASVTIGASGRVQITATAQVPGTITANVGAISIITTPTAGWAEVYNYNPASPGNPVEPDSSYRARLTISQAQPSITLVAGTAAALAAVLNVTRSQVFENPTNSTDGNGNPAHSITCVVEGGAAADIAQAIYNNKGIGCYTNGTTTHVVTDPSNGSLTQTIRWITLGYLPIYLALSVHPLAGFTTATEAQIQTNLVNYLNSLGIGQPVVYGELWAAAIGTASTMPTFAITVLTVYYQAASTTGNVTAFSNALTVTSGTGIVIGQTVVGIGIPDGTTIASGSGTSWVMSANAATTGVGIALQFFTAVSAGTSITPAFDQAASSNTTDVVITLV